MSGCQGSGQLKFDYIGAATTSKDPCIKNYH
jgi:hypothetical protein